jgi:hypothetical protein
VNQRQKTVAANSPKTECRTTTKKTARPNGGKSAAKTAAADSPKTECRTTKTARPDGGESAAKTAVIITKTAAWQNGGESAAKQRLSGAAEFFF